VVPLAFRTSDPSESTLFELPNAAPESMHFARAARRRCYRNRLAETPIRGDLRGPGGPGLARRKAGDFRDLAAKEGRGS